MDSVLKIVSGAFVGTSVMTLFSYAISYLMKKQFREPQLLNYLLRQSELLKRKTVPPISGWMIHYGVGITLVIAYHFIWNLSGIDINYANGSLLGFVSGFIGIAGWASVFSIHANPPSIDFKGHYIHLVIAHILFGIGATGGYLMI